MANAKTRAATTRARMRAGVRLGVMLMGVRLWWVLSSVGVLGLFTDGE